MSPEAPGTLKRAPPRTPPPAPTQLQGKLSQAETSQDFPISLSALQESALAPKDPNSSRLSPTLAGRWAANGNASATNAQGAVPAPDQKPLEKRPVREDCSFGNTTLSECGKVT